MLEQYLGRERFRDGVRRYLKAHAYSNTETTDLWDAIEQVASDEPVRELMDTWIFQGGYPLIEARSREGAPGIVEITQTPFSYLPSDARDDSAIGNGWLVPVIFGSGSRNERILLGTETVELKFDGAPRINAGGSGFFRVQHDAALLETVLQNFGALSATERHNLLADAWAVALSGRGRLEEFLSIVGALGDEPDPYVWSVVIGASGLLDLAATTEDRPLLRTFVHDLLAPVLDRVGWIPAAGEDEQTPLLRAALVGALGSIAEDPLVIAEARRLFALDADGEGGLPADLAASVLGVVASHATRDEFDAILDRYRHPSSPMAEARHLNALAAVRDPELAEEVRELCRTEVRSQNAPYVIGAMLRNRYTGEDTFRYVAAHFAELSERFPDNSIHRMLEGVTGLVLFDDAGTPLLLDEVRSFLRAHVPGARARLIEQSLERLEVNLRFATTIRGDLGTLLRRSS
jgi:puromycin-sensitive aminopeptidase